MKTYQVYEYDFVLHERGNMIDEFRDKELAKLNAFKEAKAWCESETPTEVEVNGKVIGFRGDSDFGTIII